MEIKTSFPQKSWGEFNKIILSKKDFRLWGLGHKKLDLGELSPEDVGIKPYVQNPSFNFLKKDLFFSRSWGESNKIMKSQKYSSTWGLGPRNYVWVTWVKRTYRTTSPEPSLQFSQTGPLFLSFCNRPSFSSPYALVQ